MHCCVGGLSVVQRYWLRISPVHRHPGEGGLAGHAHLVKSFTIYYAYLHKHPHDNTQPLLSRRPDHRGEVEVEGQHTAADSRQPTLTTTAAAAAAAAAAQDIAARFPRSSYPSTPDIMLLLPSPA